MRSMTPLCALTDAQLPRTPPLKSLLGGVFAGVRAGQTPFAKKFEKVLSHSMRTPPNTPEHPPSPSHAEIYGRTATPWRTRTSRTGPAACHGMNDHSGPFPDLLRPR